MKTSHIPLIIITGLMIHSLYQVGTSNKAFTYPHYIGLSLILITLVLLIFSEKMSKLATFFTLLIGVFSQAAFTTTISRLRIGGSINEIGPDILIQPLCLFLMVLFIVFNWKFMKEIIMETRRLLSKDEQDDKPNM